MTLTKLLPIPDHVLISGILGAMMMLFFLCRFVLEYINCTRELIVIFLYVFARFLV
jgi:hypothetical protein